MTATTRTTSTSRTDQPIHQLVIRAKRAVFPDGIRPAVVVVDDERITALLEDGAAVEAREEIVVPDDQVLMPGLVDSHVHVNEPGRTPWEGYESATRAGLAGGITTILDMPLNSSPPTTTVDNLDAKEEAAQGKLSVDVGFWGGAVPGNIDQMAPLWDKGVFGFKCFTAHSGIDEYGYLGYEGVKEVLAKLAELDAVLMDLLGQHDDSYSSCSVSPGSRPAVIDAGALLLLAERLRGGARCAPTHVLTPHAGEAAALLTTLGASISRTEVEAAPAACALDLARLTGGTVVLKGAPTLIAGPVSSAAPSGPSPEFSEPPESLESSAGSSGPAALRLLSVNAGPGWLATAGSGDVLAGILGAVLAAAQSEAERGGPAVAVSHCAALAVRLHAVAAELASGCRRPSSGRPLAALDLADHLPRACATVGGWAA